MKVAVVSTDSINVDEHFGRASRFLIYNYDGAKLRLEEERPSETLSVGDPSHDFDPDRFRKVLKAVEGCKKVIAVKIGATPASKLIENGIEPIIYTLLAR